MSHSQVSRTQHVVNLLPGPVALGPEVREAFCSPPVSHRNIDFHRDLEDARDMLGELTGARRVQLFLGSGTLANDVIAAQLSLLNGCGLVLSNGEFGERLVDHAARLGLIFRVLRAEWGAIFDLAEVDRLLGNQGHVDWLWCTHCETSTGILNDIVTILFPAT